ncbi:hypothetical protein [Streptomyces sp. NPDC005780]|uniref:hypothetical protein n=1 Tax=Streptomyces sp. NPDC005780 TaxID=3364730 RepID=UPI00369C1E9C
MEILDVLAAMAKTGRLGPAFSGADWRDVTEAFGEPWEIGTMSRRRKWPRLFGYGDLELSVCRCRKVGIICVQTWRDVVELPPSVTGGAGTFASGLTYADVVATLDRAGCSWETCPSLTFGDQRTLVVTSTGASFTFAIPEGESPVLHGVGLPGDGHDCSAPTAGP